MFEAEIQLRVKVFCGLKITIRVVKTAGKPAVLNKCFKTGLII